VVGHVQNQVLTPKITLSAPTFGLGDIGGRWTYMTARPMRPRSALATTLALLWFEVDVVVKDETASRTTPPMLRLARRALTKQALSRCN
jgi:hypothetical protein